MDEWAAGLSAEMRSSAAFCCGFEMAEQSATPEMTPRAAEAFDLYVAMGPRRSLRALARELVQQNLYKTTTVAFRQLGEWSSKYGWSDRIASAATAIAESRLEQAAELDADTFFKTSELLAEAIEDDVTTLDEVLTIRASVRKPVAKAPTLNINVNLIVKELAEKYGLTEQERAELFEEMQEDLNKARVGAS